MLTEQQQNTLDDLNYWRRNAEQLEAEADTRATLDERIGAWDTCGTFYILAANAAHEFGSYATEQELRDGSFRADMRLIALDQQRRGGTQEDVERAQRAWRQWLATPSGGSSVVNVPIETSKKQLDRYRDSALQRAIEADRMPCPADRIRAWDSCEKFCSITAGVAHNLGEYEIEESLRRGARRAARKHAKLSARHSAVRN